MFKFKAANMQSFYDDEPAFFTVLVRRVGAGNQWQYCGNKAGQIPKFKTMKEAKEEAKRLQEKFDSEGE